MGTPLKAFYQKIKKTGLSKKYERFRSSIYGRVVFIIASSFFILFILFNIVFRSIYVDFFNKTIRQTGDNISSIVESSLYYSMLENDKGMMQRTLDILNTMSGIGQVNVYDDQNRLAYTSGPAISSDKSYPNCIGCHDNLSEMFALKEKTYRIIDDTSNCGLFTNNGNARQLLIRTPILNEKSCYTSNCHYHTESDEVLGSLIIQLPLNELDAVVDESSTNFLLIAFIITTLLATILIIFTRKKIKDPLYSIIKASKAVSSGDKSIRLIIKPNQLNDLKMVSLAFNNMLDNLNSTTEELQNWSQQLEYKVQKKTEELSQAQNELIHVERIASLGKLSSSVAHELNNPLSGILIYTKLIYKQLNDSEFQHSKKDAILKHLKLVETETKRCGDIVNGLLDFSRKDQEDFEEKSIHQIINSTYDLMIHSIKIAQINFTKDFNADFDKIYCSPNQLKQALVAILVNASEAIQEQGEIMIKTSNPDKESILVEIIDNGTGIAPQDLPNIFEPFFSRKREGNGIGLGLAIVHGIIQNHKGKISVDSIFGEGAAISIKLPLNNK